MPSMEDSVLGSSVGSCGSASWSIKVGWLDSVNVHVMRNQ